MNTSTIAWKTRARIPLGEAEPAGAPRRDARRFYGENVSRFSEAAEQVHPRHGLRDTGDRRHDHHGHRPCRRAGGQAPQCREPTEPQPAGRGTSRKDQRRHPDRRHAGRRQGDGRTRHPRLRQGNIPRPKVAAKRCPSMGGTDPPSTTTSSTTRGSSLHA